MAKHYEEVKDYKKSEYFVKQLKDKSQLLNFYKRYSQYLLSKNLYKKSIKIAKRTKDKQLLKYIYSTYVQFLINKNKLERALKFAKKSKQEDLIQFAASKLYNFYYKKIDRNRTNSYNKSLYKKMLKLAFILKDQKLIAGLKKTIKGLN